ncbi:MAG: peptidase C1 [Sphingomonadales bacterium]|nr:MAG: peptidase C1 [Sphingomonadales bacterium]
MSISVQKDLTALFGDARDQGARPTCLAFAASDCHASLRGKWAPLSAEWLYYCAQARGNRSSSEGATLPDILSAARHDGQPFEAAWPYLVPPVDPWKPPTGIAPIYRREGQQGLAVIASVVASLDADRPLILLLNLSRSFFTPTADGIVHPAVGELPDTALRHAVVATAHGVVDGRPAIFVRNSWGGGWGCDGSAWLTEEFLSPRLFATAELLGEV